MATEYTKENALAALPYLIHFARKRQVVTYKELADRIGKHHRVVRHILGYIRDEICIQRDLPLLSAIVVNGDTNMPGNSFLPEGTWHLPIEEKRAKFELHRDAVFNEPGWESLLKELGLEPITKTPDELVDEARIYSEYMERSGGGEQEDHRRLKEFICAHPEYLGIENARPGKMEYLLASGDRCDVLFDLSARAYIAEIKVGIRGELMKGVFQAIKYRCVYEAERGLGVKFPVKVFLVAYTIPVDIQDMASRFNIQCVCVPREIVSEGSLT